MLSQVDFEVNHYQLLTEVTYHKIDNSTITKAGSFIKSSNGNLHQKRKTRVWKLLVEWKDGSVHWVTLEDLKQSNPFELSEYAMADEISDKPAFRWWFKEIFFRQDSITYDMI